jgi:hypothetical protein
MPKEISSQISSGTSRGIPNAEQRKKNIALIRKSLDPLLEKVDSLACQHSLSFTPGRLLSEFEKRRYPLCSLVVQKQGLPKKTFSAVIFILSSGLMAASYKSQYAMRPSCIALICFLYGLARWNRQ